MPAILKTTQIQEPSSATVNLALDTSGGVTVGQNLTVTGTATLTGGVASAGLQLNGSSSGTTTLAAQSAASGIVTIAAQTGTLNAAGPAFHAGAGGAQTVSNGVNTKVTLTEDFDTNADFSSSRFTPSVAGYYQINGGVIGTASTSMAYVGALIYKNGSSYSFIYGAASTSTNGYGFVSDIVYCNGTTDYIELYARLSGSGTLTITGNTFFSGCLIRGA